MRRTIAEIATLIDQPKQTIGAWTKNGLRSRKTGRHRTIDDTDLIAFLASRNDHAGSSLDRLLRAKSVKCELSNREKRSKLVLARQMRSIMVEQATDFAARLDALPDRVAAVIATTTDSALIRELLLDAVRDIRSVHADFIAQQSNSGDSSQGNGQAAFAGRNG